MADRRNAHAGLRLILLVCVNLHLISLDVMVYTVIGVAVIIHQYPFRIVLAD